MASTPTPSRPERIPIKAAARKLPFKRKTPESPSLNPNPNPNFAPNLVPKIETAYDEDDPDGEYLEDLKPPPPFKFHRIWSESDEIRFLQGLLDSSADGLAFPRDLHLFYDRFSCSMSQPYTKSQLSEKLRRLRKKFRVIFARISRGLDASRLSQHDRSLFDISKQLWQPEYASSSPFHSSNQKKSTGVRSRVGFSPTPSSVSCPPITQPLIENSIRYVDCIDNNNNIDDDDDGGDGVEINEVLLECNVGAQEEELPLPVPGVAGFGSSGGGHGRIAAKTVLSVFDNSLKEVRMDLVCRGLLYPDHGSAPVGSSKQGAMNDFEKRWREQQVAELDVFACRMRLVLERALHEQ